jgi:iron complex outermembrane recepter protein
MNQCFGNRSKVRVAICVALSSSVVFMSMFHNSFAQTTTDAAPARSEGLEEIVVTATKREANLEKVPISITALSSADIQRDRVLTLDDVEAQVPGLEFLHGTSAENYLSIRGAVTVDDSSGNDQGVSLFIDDIVRTGVADVSPDLYDLDRIEVLKGPQGTLFGRNSTGGVISIYTKNPTFTPETSLEATYGNFNLGELKGVFNGPIVDGKLAGRLALTTHYRDGWVDDPVLGRKLGSEDRQTARGKLLFTPLDDLKALFGFDYARGQGSRTDWAYGNFHPTLQPGIIFGRDSTSSGVAGTGQQESWGTTARIDWANSIGTLTSISGFRHVTARDSANVAADPLNTIILTSASRDKQFTEELRLASAADQKLTWVSGLYYLHSSKSRPVDIHFTILPGSFFDSIGLGPVIPAMTRQNTNTSSYGVFGEATYAIVEKLKLTLGARYTDESKNGFSLLNPSATISGPPASATYEKSWAAFTPKATITYQPMEELITYITASKGFQGGGFNTQGSTPAALMTPIKPEFLWNYETGLKFEGLDHRLQANIAAFLDRYSQLQLTELNGATLSFTTTSAGSASIKGVEANVAVLPVRWFTLGVIYSYLHSEFTNYVIDNGPGVPPTIDTGNKIPFVPTQSVTLNGDVHFDLPNLKGKVDIGADYTYRSSMQLDAANDVPKYLTDRTIWNGLINAHLSWASEDDRWGVAIWGKNLRNIEYTSRADNQTGFYETPAETINPALSIFTYHPNDPRTFGITLRMRL